MEPLMLIVAVRTEKAGNLVVATRCKADRLTEHNGQTSSPFEVQASTPTRFERRGLVRHGKRHLRKAEPQRYAAVRDRNGSGRARFRAAIERQECVAHARLDGDATEAIRRADRLFRGDEAAVVGRSGSFDAACGQIIGDEARASVVRTPAVTIRFAKEPLRRRLA